LRTTLLLSDRDGAPIAPVQQSLRCAEGLHQSHTSTLRRKLDDGKLDRLLRLFRLVGRQSLGKPPVFVIDREADSVGHYRDWDRHGFHFVVRADDTRKVLYQGQERLLPEVYQQLRRQDAFRCSRGVDYQGQTASQYVAEAEVRLHRPSKRQHGRISKRGKALLMRLVVTEVRDDNGVVLAYWLLLTNVPRQFDAATVALWYYWRWRVESYFKLLKSAGQELEHWQQRSGLAVAKRLLVASMACVLVWKLARSKHPKASWLRRLLVRLSGRQMKRGVESTQPALLAGLWSLLQSLALLEQFDVGQLQETLKELLHEGVRRSNSSRPPPKLPRCLDV
jgi:hypothetical protein